MKKNSQTNQSGIIFIPLFFIVPIVAVGLYFGAGTGFWENMTSGIRKFLAAPSPSNLPQQIGQWQQDPTRKVTPTPTLEIKGEVLSKPFVFKPETSKSGGGIPSFTITAPSGWVKVSSSGNELAHFESTQIDSEKVDGGTITTNAIINVKATDSYSDLSDFAKQYKASGSKAKNSRLVNTQSLDSAQVLEFTYQKEISGNPIIIHELVYLYFKDGISFLAKGYSSDSAWGSHSSSIQSSLASFKFN